MSTSTLHWPVAGKSVLVVGLARSGRAAAKLCLAEEATVTVADARTDADLEGLEGVTPALGPHRVEDFTAAELIVVSPGVPADLPELNAARDAGVPVIPEVELAWDRLKDLPSIAITGTNGKSTTTALVGEMMRTAGHTPFVGGNIGRALSEAVLAETRPTALALELSSYQIETSQHLAPTVAVCLNLTPDHLARHKNLENYGAIKARLLTQATGHAIVNADDAAVAAMAPKFGPKVHRFGAGTMPGDGDATFDETGVHIGAAELPVTSPALRGAHNRANAAAAALAAFHLGLPVGAIAETLADFGGLPHRLELIRSRDGVEWINDSKATNLDSAATALKAFPKGVIWIAGGQGKGVPYTPLRPDMARLSALLGIGEDGPVILEALGDAVNGPAENVETLERAVERADALATEGEVVLLSPACASFDQFTDYEARGEAFRSLVAALPGGLS